MSSVKAIERGQVRGFLHAPEAASSDGVVLAHGAGGDCNAKLLVVAADALCEAGFIVLRINLPFRQARPQGPPFPATAAADRCGIEDAAVMVRSIAGGRVVIGGHSYGGRQATMLAAEDASVADALLLLSYPLHPPRKPDQPRTAHFPDVRTTAVFVHGTRDPFGSPEEMRTALRLLGGQSIYSEIDGAGHDLRSGKFDIHERLIKPLRDALA